MSEICKICGRDTTTDKIYCEVSETPRGESYVVCCKCYPLKCPKCGKEMDTEDGGCDQDGDSISELVFCLKCNIEYGATCYTRAWYFWYSQYCRDVEIPNEIAQRERAAAMAYYKNVYSKRERREKYK